MQLSPTPRSSAPRLGRSTLLLSSLLALALLPLTEAAGLQGGGNRTRRSVPGAGAPGGGAAGPGQVGPGTLQVPLSQIEVPLPPDLDTYVKDMDAAVRLGKAFFWDVQVGSDSLVACATCHYNGGADVRVKSQLAPGCDDLWDMLTSGANGPNSTVTSEDFPFHLLADLNDMDSRVLRSSNDALTSAGVPQRVFQDVTPGEGVEAGFVVPDPIFNVGGLNTDRMEPRNAPTVINAVFNHRQFWDGRADFNFNGVNIWGDRDQNARVLRTQPSGAVDYVQVSIEKASLASQAVGPPLSGFEMSWAGKSFKKLGRKMLAAEPLKLREVDSTDMHLGGLSAMPDRGLTPGLTYEAMIQEAFVDAWWNGSGTFAGHTMMEHNFSLYWGLAILCYEAQLVSDQSPYDLYEAGDEDALTEQEKRGMNRFFSGGAACADCHYGTEFAGGTWSQIMDPLGNNGEAVERMGMLLSGQNAELGLTTVPGPVDPTVIEDLPYWYLGFDPRGMTMEILRPDTGQVMAYGPVPGGGGCLETEVEGTLMDGPGAPTAPIDPVEPEPAGEYELTVTTLGQTLPDGTCGVRLHLNVHIVEDADTPGGSYPVLLNGTQIGTLELPVSAPKAVYDVGYYNIGVRPTSEDEGQGRDGPFGPLSITKRLQQGDPTVAHLDLADPVRPDEYAAVNGAYRASSLRNISLTGPYMHNGSMSSLEQVVQFYARGADFAHTNIADLSPEVLGVGALRNDPEEQAAMVAFMANGLLDPRVANSSDVFSHPSLPIKVGFLGDEFQVIDNGEGEATPEVLEIPATGMAGGDESPEFLDLLEASLLATLSGSEHTGVNEDLLVVEESGNIGCGLLGRRNDSDRVARVWLGNRPSATVTIPVSVSGTGVELKDGVTQLVFTSSNWFHPQELRIVAVQDHVVDGTEIASVVFGAASSADPNYNGRVLPGYDFEVLDTSNQVDVLYVDVNATDSFENGTEDYPFHSIANALGCNDLSVTLQLAPGTYYEDVFIQNRDVDLIAPEGATLQGSGTAPVITIFGTNTGSSRLEGLVITGGSGLGGGVFATDGADVDLVNCTVRENTGDLGGGLFGRNNAELDLVDCLVELNSSMNGAGGMQLEGGSTTTHNTLFLDNTGREGGALAARNAASLTLTDCTLSANQADRGGAVAMDGGSLTLTRCKVTGNAASDAGGGIHGRNSAHVHLLATKVTNNQAPTAGGIYMDNGVLEIDRSTVATNGQSLYVMNSTEVDLNSSILWEDGSGQAVASSGSQSIPGTVVYSIVDGDELGDDETVLHLDPLFRDAASGDHGVESGSPAIDSGDPSLEPDPDGSAPDMGSHPFLGL